MAQRDAGQLRELMELACLFTWLAPKIEVLLGKGKVMDEISNMWINGKLGNQLKRVHFWGDPEAKEKCCGI